MAKYRIALTLLGTTALTLGYLSGVPSQVPLVLAAQCQAAHPACGGTPPDLTRTSALHVLHYRSTGANQIPGEPNDGETWDIVAYWNSAGPGQCSETTETASTEVSWTGAGWSLSNTTTTTNILAITVCDIGSETCKAEDTHSYGYKLIVDINQQKVVGFTPHNLRQVVYTTTSMDDGFELDTSNCTLGTGRTPIAESFTGTDTPPFACPFNCSQAGATVTITYE